MDYVDPGWIEPLRQAGFGFTPWRSVRSGQGRPGTANMLVGLRVIFLSIVLALLLFLFVLSFIVEEGFAGDVASGANVVIAGAGVVSLWGVSALARRPLRTDSIEALLASYRTAFFIQVATAEAAALAGFVGSFVTRSLWSYTVGLAFALAGLYLAAPSRRNIERRQEQIAGAGLPLSIGRLLTAPTGPPDRPDTIPR